MLLIRTCAACLPDDQISALADIPQALSNSALHGRAWFAAVACGEICTSPTRLWMQSRDGAAYVFDGVDLDADQVDILATAAAYLDSPNGWIEDARPCGRLRFCLTARIPASRDTR